MRAWSYGTTRFIYVDLLVLFSCDTIKSFPMKLRNASMQFKGKMSVKLRGWLIDGLDSWNSRTFAVFELEINPLGPTIWF